MAGRMGMNFLNLLAVLLFFGAVSAATIVEASPRTRWTRQSTSNQTSLKLTMENLKDASLVMQIDQPWEDFIIPAPAVISLLGGLTVLSGKVDFSLNERPPIGGFQHVRHPDSFRASLVQVSNDGWSAFHNAHRNMDTIQLSMQQIPVHVRTAMKVIAGAPAELFQGLLEVPLTTIKEVGKQCVDLSKETELKFVNVMLLMGEILEATASSKGLYDTKLKLTQMELNASRVQKEQLNNINSLLVKREQQLSKAVEKYQAAYESALAEIPTGWELIGQKFVQGIAEGVNSFVKIACDPIGTTIGVGGGLKNLFTGGGQASSSSGGGSSPTQSSNVGSADNIEDTLALVTVEQFHGLLEDIKAAIDNFFAKTNKGNPVEEFAAYEGLLKSFRKILEGQTSSKIAKKALAFLHTGQTLLSDMKALSNNISSNSTSEKKAEILCTFDKLKTDISPMYAESVASKKDLSAGKPPKEPSSIVDVGSDNARFKAQLNVEQLRAAEKQYDKVFEDMMKQQDTMKNLMVRMATLDMETVNYQQVIELMKEGIQALAEIRKQWSKLTEFFSSIAVRAEITVNHLLRPFVKKTEVAQRSPVMSKEARDFLLKLLVPQEHEIQKSAYFLFTLSKTYVDVSSRFILDKLAGLAGLTALEPSQRSAALAELRRNSETATSEIKKMVQDRRLQYKDTMQKKITDGEKYVQQLGGVTELQKEAIKEGLRAAQQKKDPDEEFALD